MKKGVRIGTRDSELASWQATLVQQQLRQHGVSTELVYIKSEGDIDLVTPLYEMGVQGIFTKTLDTALLNNRVDIAVHSMKDVPTQLANGLQQAAVLERGSYADLLVYKKTGGTHLIQAGGFVKKMADNILLTIATSSVRRRAQWLNRFPRHQLENLRGNINTRMQKLADSKWDGAIFAAAGLERIGLRPEHAIEIDWMLPAPSQGAIMVVCREEDNETFASCAVLNHKDTALCTQIEKDFLRELMGGCTTPVGALAILNNDTVTFRGNILSLDGKQKIEISRTVNVADSANLGTNAAYDLLQQGADKIIAGIKNAGA